MVKSLSAYLPHDRRTALGRGRPLPDSAQGSAVFADISGFTPLTEQLTQQLGARRGVEELTRRINAVYDALIRVVEQHGGSVVSFAGDSITCWFDTASGTASGRAVASALGLQAAMRAFPGLSLKVAVASGTARRFVVGDPQLQLLDTLAGETIARLARAEHLARQGEVLADTATVEAYGDTVQITEWRIDPASNERFALIAIASMHIETVPLPVQADDVPSETLRAWVLPTVYAREQSGLGEFLTELRPIVALFLRFTGIDYDADESAQHNLDDWIRRVQHVVARYEGTLLQLTIGDKGSYLYICFGASTAHEDDARRAVQAALALRDLPRELTWLQPLQIGLSRGTLRVGAYGGATRRTYAALGDEVNVAARLMSTAAPGEILLSGRVQQLLGDHFTLEPRPPLPLKGKAEPLPVFAVTGVQRHRATRLLEPAYRLPMIGRQDELALIANKLELVRQGQGQIVGITAEAGMGKSRLIAEAIRLAHRQGFAAFGGACESSGANTAYLVWKAIWQAFFDIDPTAPMRRQLRHLEGEIQDRAPGRLQAMPLLTPLLDLQMDDNDFTRTLEPKDRRNALEALLEDCLKAAVKEEPILFVLEDVHWIDPLSHDLLESLARATVNAAVCFVLAYRPPELERLRDSAPRMEALPNFAKMALNELTPADAEQLIRAKLAQLFPERGGGLPKRLVEQLTTKAQGNPFFIEELLNYLRDRDISPYDEQAVSALELPSSLHTLILSRIDQLTEAQKAALKVASIIGRLFTFAWLHGYYPTLGTADSVKSDLTELARLDLTPLDTPEPELAYLFKHIVTHEVTYESLPYATRAQLHEQLAQFVEAQGADKYLNLLAYHYRLSENKAKQHEYLRKAGEAAQAAYANEAALDYYGQLLPLLTEPNEQIDMRLKQGAVFELLGKWDKAEAVYRAAFSMAEQAHSTAAMVRCEKALGFLLFERGQLDAALEWLERARAGWATLADKQGLSQVLVKIGEVYIQKGNNAAAKHYTNESLALAREIGDRPGLAVALQMLGVEAGSRGDYTTAQALYEESLTLWRELGDKPGVAETLGLLGSLASAQGDYAAARALLEESLTLRREIGDKKGIAGSLGSLGTLAWLQGDYEAAQALTEQWLALSREIGDQWRTGLSLMHLGIMAQGHGDFVTARVFFEQSLEIGRELGAMPFVSTALENLGNVALDQNDYATARTSYVESLQISQKAGYRLGIVYALHGLAGVWIGLGDAARAARLAAVVGKLFAEMGTKLEPVEQRIYEHTLASAKAALGEDVFAQAWEDGKRMTLEEAIALALTTDQ